MGSPSYVELPAISFIVARSEPAQIIGCEDQIPWRLKTDLKLFRSITFGHPIIMGRKTLDSIGKPLDGRINIVLSRTGGENSDKIQWASSPEEALFIADYFSVRAGKSDVFVIGGGNIYEEFSQQFNKIYLTEVQAPKISGDTFFRYKFDKRRWKEIRREDYPASEVDEFSFSLVVLEKTRKKRRTALASKFLKADVELDAWAQSHMDIVRSVYEPIQFEQQAFHHQWPTLLK